MKTKFMSLFNLTGSDLRTSTVVSFTWNQRAQINEAYLYKLLMNLIELKDDLSKLSY